ncbi:unnamed protein product [Adineta steineri]|uniref:EGF-like domain-containing protein n=1 Tax=Adineta steineri TaxID=433720 RepID=A0A813TMC4_9BILA|nr:unnamed protein product [Adineta steineri]CAF0813778.1 unnamed protein product [Adineta steineri]CAF4008014.1 unnamed protein product [Adineta steineri]CAF4274749.1 unnamed protein product [Adineta steineri]
MSNLATISMTLDCSNSNINTHELKQSVVNKVFINVQSKQPNSWVGVSVSVHVGVHYVITHTHLQDDLGLRVWLNKSFNRFTSTCLCLPSYYGNQCQFQNQHLSLAIKFHVSDQLRPIPFIILI